MKFDLKLTTGVAAALLASACSSPRDDGWTADRDTALCVDKAGKRVPDDQCPRQQVAGGYHGGGMGSAFLWYYLGRNSVIPPYGETARGGTFSRVAGASYARAPASTGVTRAGAISRGGFGSSARGGGGFGE